MPATNLTRRTALSVGGAGLTAAALAACSPAEPASPSPTRTTDAAAPSTSPDTGTPSDAAEQPAPSGTEVAKLADIPVGGSIDATLDGEPIVLAQLEAGTVVGYSAICTHQGCVVAAAGDEFDCPCHQSRFEATTGEPIAGSKALDPLPKVTVTVSGDAVFAS